MIKPASALFLIAATATTPVVAQQAGIANPFSGNAPTGATPSPPPPPGSASGTQTRASSSGYPTLQAAQQACGTDPVVWGNTRSHAYHASDDKLFGKTKRGAYLCQSAATQSGYHAAGQARPRS